MNFEGPPSVGQGGASTPPLLPLVTSCAPSAAPCSHPRCGPVASSPWRRSRGSTPGCSDPASLRSGSCVFFFFVSSCFLFFCLFPPFVFPFCFFRRHLPPLPGRNMEDHGLWKTDSFPSRVCFLGVQTPFVPMATVAASGATSSSPAETANAKGGPKREMGQHFVQGNGQPSRIFFLLFQLQASPCLSKEPSWHSSRAGT